MKGYLKQVPFNYLCMPPLMKKDWELLKKLCEAHDLSQVAAIAMAIRVLDDAATSMPQHFNSWVTKALTEYPKRKSRGTGTE